MIVFPSIYKFIHIAGQDVFLGKGKKLIDKRQENSVFRQKSTYLLNFDY